jgi:flagellar motor switch/type III secretory pathway protein FliN
LGADRLALDVVVAGKRCTVAITQIGPITTIDDAVVAAIHGGAGPVAHAVAGGALARELGRVVLGGVDDLGAPRPSTIAEHAVWVAFCAAALARLGSPLVVEPTRDRPRGGVAIEIVVGGAARGRAVLVVSSSALERAPAPRSLADLASAGWLDAIDVGAPIAIAGARFTSDELVALRVRDVMVVERAGPTLRVGRGGIAVAIDGDRATVRAAYQRGTMDETLGDDLTVELVVSAGMAKVSARRLLELAAGDVVRLDKPADGAVELVVGGRAIGRGELVEVDGELAVRITALHR